MDRIVKRRKSRQRPSVSNCQDVSCTSCRRNFPEYYARVHSSIQETHIDVESGSGAFHDSDCSGTASSMSESMLCSFCQSDMALTKTSSQLHGVQKYRSDGLNYCLNCHADRSIEVVDSVELSYSYEPLPTGCFTGLKKIINTFLCVIVSLFTCTKGKVTNSSSKFSGKYFSHSAQPRHTSNQTNRRESKNTEPGHRRNTVKSSQKSSCNQCERYCTICTLPPKPVCNIEHDRKPPHGERKMYPSLSDGSIEGIVKKDPLLPSKPYPRQWERRQSATALSQKPQEVLNIHSNEQGLREDTTTAATTTSSQSSCSQSRLHSLSLTGPTDPIPCQYKAPLTKSRNSNSDSTDSSFDPGRQVQLRTLSNSSSSLFSINYDRASYDSIMEEECGYQHLELDSMPDFYSRDLFDQTFSKIAPNIDSFDSAPFSGMVKVKGENGSQQSDKEELFSSWVNLSTSWPRDFDHSTSKARLSSQGDSPPHLLVKIEDDNVLDSSSNQESDSTTVTSSTTTITTTETRDINVKDIVARDYWPEREMDPWVVLEENSPRTITATGSTATTTMPTVWTESTAPTESNGVNDPDHVGIGTGYPSTLTRPEEGQSLINYLISQDFNTCANLEKENAHFHISEALIAAFESMTWNRMMKKSGSERSSSSSDEEIQELRQRIRIRKREKKIEKNRPFPPVSDSQTEASAQELSPSDFPLSESSASGGESEEQEGIDLTMSSDTSGNLQALKSRGLNFSMASLYSEAELCRSNQQIRRNSSQEGNLTPGSAEQVAISLLKRFSEKHLPKASELKWLVSEVDAPQQLLPLPSSIPISPDDGENADVMRSNQTRLRGNLEWAPPRPQIIFSIHPTEKRATVLARQNFRCAGCGLRVDPAFMKRYRYCEYLGKYFCQCCHTGDTSIIPGKVIQRWDFSHYPVSNFSHNLLEKMWSEPLFHIDSVNPALYRRVRGLDAIKQGRQQLHHLSSLFEVCKRDTRLLTQLHKMPAHWIDNDNVFSVEDFTLVKNSSMLNTINTFVVSAFSHVGQCQLCQGLGFICGMCQNQRVIFPFQLNTVARCPVCHACYHKKCFVQGYCPRCIRIESRKQQLAEAEPLTSPSSGSINSQDGATIGDQHDGEFKNEAILQEEGAPGLRQDEKLSAEKDDFALAQENRKEEQDDTEKI